MENTQEESVQEVTNTEPTLQERKEVFREKFMANLTGDVQPVEEPAPEPTETINKEEEVEGVSANEEETPPENSEQYRKWQKIQEKQKEQIRKEREFQRTVKTFETQRAEWEQKVQAATQLSQQAEQDPVQFLLDRGVTYEQIIQRSLNKQNGVQAPQPTQQANETNNEYEQRLAALEQEKVQQQQAFAEQQLGQIQQNLYTAIQEAGDKYELINGLGMHQEVWNQAITYAQQYGEDPDWEKVAAHVESQLEQNYLPNLQNLTKVPKIRKTLGLGSQEEQQIETTQDSTVEPARKRPTISNSTASSAPVRESKPMTQKERIALIKKQFENAAKS